MVGHNVSHAKNRTRKVFKPNLHKTRLVVGGTSMRVRLCTKCLREVKGKNRRQIKIQNAKVKNESSVSAKVSADRQNLELKEKEVSSIAPAASGLA